jgi:hypothetical protein
VAYDVDLADRIRRLLAGEPALSEQKMFGGLAFLVGGNMAVAASGEGGLLVRADPDRFKEIVRGTNAVPMEMRGKVMTGWLRVPAVDVEVDAALARWVETGRAYAASLPVKKGK